MDATNVPLGRANEAATLETFLGGAGPGSALELSGSAGIGKTTLWEYGLSVARERGLRTLIARASSAEAQPAFAALVDLFDDVGAGELDVLASPQRRALEVALLRQDPDSSPVDRHAVALACLNTMRALSADAPLVIAIDDVQWIDEASAAAIEFVGQRIDRAPVTMLLARREGERSPLERSLRHDRLVPLPVGPLTIGATRQLLHERLGLTVSRAVMRRIADVTLGNPLFAIELGRALLAREREQDDEMPIPATVEEVLGIRVAALTPVVRHVLAALSLGADMRVGQLTQALDAGAVDDAVEGGVAVIDGDRIRAAHPLLAAAAHAALSRSELRDLHASLAEATADEAQRAAHQALASSGFDEDLAASVAVAAKRCAVRGARAQSVALAEHALRLTPPASSARSTRVLDLAESLSTAGELARMTEVLEIEIDTLPQGMPRARAWLMLSEGSGPRSLDDQERYRVRALAEAGPDPGIRAMVLAKRAANTAASRIVSIVQSEEWALEALDAARDAGPAETRRALYALSWARAMRGKPIDDLCAAFEAASPDPSYVAASPARVAAQRMVWRGEIARARSALLPLLTLADERGERQSYALMRLHVCELRLREGEWESAQALLDEWGESSDRDVMFRPQYERCRALLAAGRGHHADAVRWGSEAIERAAAAASHWDELEARHARGCAHLLGRDPAAAAETLRPAWERLVREGVEEPGVFPVVADFVQALVELGEHEEARSLIDRLARLAEEQQHPWGEATRLACSALLAFATKADRERAETDLTEAAIRFEQMGLRFDAARCLLWLGRDQRRLRKWGEARRNLGLATSTFAEIGSGGWVTYAGDELDRVSARRPAPSGELTPAERRAAELAAAGLSNKEIARQLVVTIHTVEVHLSRVYAKLGIRSRSQLSGRLAAAPKD